MSVYKEYLEKKTKDQLINIILANTSTAKAVRNEMIEIEYPKLVTKMPIMEAYVNLSITHGISERTVMYILNK